MKVTKIDDVYGAFIIDADREHNDLGWVQKAYSTSMPFPHMIGKERQINILSCNKNSLRGMKSSPFAKMCSVLNGNIYFAIADCRAESRTYLKWFGVWIDSESKKQIFVPSGCGFGFFSPENSMILMFQDGVDDPNNEITFSWKDPKFNLVWPSSQEYIMSNQDKFAGDL